MKPEINRSIFFDQLGVLYTFRNENGMLVPVESAIDFLYGQIKKLPRYKHLKGGEELPIEEEVGVELELHKAGKLKIGAVPYAVENIIESEERGIKPIMVSSNLLSTMYIVRDEIVRQYNEGQITGIDAKLLVPDNQCISFTEEKGNKKDPHDWQRIAARKCPGTKAIMLYEDKEERIDAAMQALGVIGFHVVNYNFGELRVADNQFMGSMQQLLGVLKNLK